MESRTTVEVTATRSLWNFSGSAGHAVHLRTLQPSDHLHSGLGSISLYTLMDEMLPEQNAEKLFFMAPAVSFKRLLVLHYVASPLYRKRPAMELPQVKGLAEKQVLSWNAATFLNAELHLDETSLLVWRAKVSTTSLVARAADYSKEVSQLVMMTGHKSRKCYEAVERSEALQGSQQQTFHERRS